MLIKRITLDNSNKLFYICHQHAHPASRKNSALRVSFLFLHHILEVDVA